MQNNSYPLFTKGRTLKKESLDSMRDFPRDLFNTAFCEYSDGVLWGLSVSAHHEHVYISSGAIKHLGEIIVVKDEKLPFNMFEKCVSTKIFIGSKQFSKDFEIIPLEIRVDDNLSLRENEWELGRFMLSKGARLRLEYTGVSDFKTTNNTLDITNVLYAGIGKSTFSVKLLKIFAQTLLQAANPSHIDTSFAFTVLNSDVVHRELILWYIAKRLNHPFKELNNAEIYQNLVLISGNRKGESPTHVTSPRKRPLIG